MMKPVRKVKAQRKFAQGALVPSSNPIMVGKRKTAEQPRATANTVIRNHVPASVLLDIVSFKSIHSHPQPVVLLERLKNSTIQKNKNQSQDRILPNAKAKVTKPPPQYVWDMALRSRATPKSKETKASKRKKTRRTASPRVKRKRQPAKECTPDDNTPLTYFAAKSADKGPIVRESDSHLAGLLDTTLPGPSVSCGPIYPERTVIDDKGPIVRESDSHLAGLLGTSLPGPSVSCGPIYPERTVIDEEPSSIGIQDVLEDVTSASIEEESELDLRWSDSNCSVKSENWSDAGSELDSFPKTVDRAKLVDAPVFYPTQEEFADPIAYFEKIAPVASTFGLCKVIPPPLHRFQPKCKMSDDIRFDVKNQYISRLFNRWGPAARELCAIKACLNKHNLNLTRSPLLDGIEVNLAKLYHVVQRNGGLEQVIDKKQWGRVAQEMSFTKTPNPERKLDNIYVKYLLPYDTLSHKERQEIIRKVEKHWNLRNQKLLDRALNPLYRRKRLLGELESSDEDTGDESDVGNALAEAEDCVAQGSCMNLSKFKKIAAIVMENNFRSVTDPSPEVVEELYWRLVLLGTEHVCVNTASIDTGDEGYGFSRNSQDPYSRHPWNLKMLSENSRNALRSIGPVLGLTVPSLHLGMVFSTSCWHSDPHGLPWIEYMHQGSPKIWYGIPNEQSSNFRKAVETLCPTSCQNKSIWLPSDIMMIPPTLLLEHNVSMSKVAQKPGEFIMVYPEAYSCSISTGYSLTESVYFALKSWLQNVLSVFQELRDSCEPGIFSLEHLLLSVVRDPQVPLSELQQAHHTLSNIVTEELLRRDQLKLMGLTFINDRNHQVDVNRRRRTTSAWNARDYDECQMCRMTLYLSKVTGLTGKKESVCLLHALRLLEARKGSDMNLAALQVYIYIPREELEDAVQQQVKRRDDSPVAGCSTQLQGG